MTRGVPTSSRAPRWALYARVSTQEQSEGVSIEMQLAALTDLAERQGASVAGIWTDIESGRNEDRPNYRAMLAAAKTWDIVAVWKTDRLGRDAAELFRAAKELRRVGKDMVSVTENIEDPFIRGLMFLLAQRESDVIGQRVRTSMRHLSAEGRYLSRAPLGYTMTRGVDGLPLLLVEPVGAALYLEMVELIEAGQSPRNVAVILNNARIQPMRRAAQWGHTTIRRLIRNPLHAGLVRVPGSDELVKGVHAPIIDRDRWEALQPRAHAGRQRPEGASFLLSGFAWCGCGSALTPHSARAPGYIRYYYRCAGVSAGKDCDYPGALPMELLHAAVEWRMEDLFKGDERFLLSRARAHLANERLDQNDATVRRARKATDDAERAQRQLEGLVDMRARGELDDGEYLAARQRARELKVRAEVALAELPPPPIEDRKLVDMVKALTHLAGEWSTTTVTIRRDFLGIVGLRVRREESGVRLTVAPHILPLAGSEDFLPFVGPARRVDGLPGRLVVPGYVPVVPHGKPSRTIRT